MKVTIGQINTTIGGFVRLILFVLLINACFFYISAPGQPTLKDRTKNFGKSLKKYGGKDKKDSQIADGAQDEDTIRIETNLIVSDVLVVNQKGFAITGLTQNDFVVLEDNTLQEISLFSPGENAKIPRSIVLVIDYSSSLLPFINNSIEAAKALVEKLDSRDRMAIVTDDVELFVDFTTDKTLLRKKLESLKEKTLKDQGGKSMQFSALLAVLNELFDDEDIRPIIIFQTDGDERYLLKSDSNRSGKEKNAYNRLCLYNSSFCERNFGFSDIIEEIEKSRATIYSIIPGVKLLGLSEAEQTKQAENILKIRLGVTYKNEPRILKELEKSRGDVATIRNAVLTQQDSLFRVAELSGGYTDFIEMPEDAERVYSTIFSTINRRYIIGYYSKNEIKDGKRRIVKIEVKGHPEYAVFNRKSYFAPKENK